jgi:DNA-binding transcriptional MocR family regulator
MREYLKTTYGIGREFDEVNIISGGQQAMDYAAKVLCMKEIR